MSSAQRDSGEFGAVTDGERPLDTEPNADDAAPARIDVRCAGRTAVGQVRDHNEDNFVVANLETGQIRPRDEVVHDEIGERGVLFAVCDGMGGAAAGEVASQMAVDILVEALRRGGAPKNRDALARRLVSAVEEAGKRIYESAQRERSRRGMGTTATVAVLVDKVLFLAEVGDSRAYLVRGSEMKQLTKDQSLVNQLIEAGHLTEAEAEAFEHSNIILQALGTSETVQVDLTFVELRRGDRLMMCSDGLSGLVHNDMLRTTLESVKDPAECTAKLIEYAEAAGGHDNITVVIADFDGEGLTDAAEGDSFGYLQYPLPPDDAASAFLDEDTESSFRQPLRDPHEAATAPPPAAARRERERERDRDQGESLLPLSGDTGDGQGNALWFIGGALALAAGVAVWLWLEPSAANRQQAEEMEEHHATAPAQEPPVAHEAEVEVKVYTDVAGAKLLVNGEDRGELPPEQSKSLRLKPGAYRFEAQSAGSPAAVSVVTVRGDMPMDVFLQAPHTGAGAVAPEGEQPNGQSAAGSGAAAAPSTPSGEATKPAQPAPDDEGHARRAAARAARRAAERAAAEAAAPAAPPTAEGAPAPAAAAPAAAPATPASNASGAAPAAEPKHKHPSTGAPEAPSAAPPAPPAAPKELPDNPF